MGKELLIVDDKISVCKSLEKNFSHWGYKCHLATNRKKALEFFYRNKINAVIMDIVLNEESGIDILREITTSNKKVPVIMITGYASIETAITSIKMGAYDYIKKPIDFNNLLEKIESAIISARDMVQNNKDHDIDMSKKMYTKNQYTQELYDKAKRLANTNIPILLFGENGVGKEILADFIHANSPRSANRIVKINCANFPDHLLDNELFGHEAGAYTGAHKQFKGVFEQAHEGTIFLDEIGDMSPPIQSKILRTIQNHEIRRLGGNRIIHINVRFIAATNKDLNKLIEERLFRSDLYYRLSAATLNLPSLKMRKEDIPHLITLFLQEFSNINQIQITSTDNISKDAMEIIMQYNWPGNIRELKNTIYYARAITTKDYIDVEDFPSYLVNWSKKHKNSNFREENEKLLIIKTLQESNYNRTKAAQILNMSRKTIYNKMIKFGLSNDTKTET